MTDQPATKLHCPKWWTVEQKQLLEQLRADNVDWSEVAVRCGHTIGSCRTTLTNIKARRMVREDAAPKKARRLPWSMEEVAELVRLREMAGLNFNAIDKILNRRRGSAVVKYQTLQLGPDPQHVSETGGRVHVTPKEQAEFKALKLAQNRQSDISRLLGEPPPGYSALDQKRASGEAPR